MGAVYTYIPPMQREVLSFCHYILPKNLSDGMDR